MQILRLLLVTVVTWGLFFWLLRTAVRGLRSGSVSHTDTSSQVARSDNPAGYWLLVTGFVMGGVGSAVVWVYVLLDVLG